MMKTHGRTGGCDQLLPFDEGCFFPEHQLFFVFFLTHRLISRENTSFFFHRFPFCVELLELQRAVLLSVLKVSPPSFDVGT